MNPTAPGGAATPQRTAAPRSTGFLRDLADQLRAGDSYGRLDRLSDDQLLRPLVLTAEQRQEVPVSCDLDPATGERVRAFYQAVAVGVERSTGVMTGAVLDLGHEGFGRALVLAGRLVVVADVLRDAQRFGFASTQALAARGEQLVGAGVAAIAADPEVARAED